MPDIQKSQGGLHHIVSTLAFTPLLKHLAVLQQCFVCKSGIQPRQLKNLDAAHETFLWTCGCTLCPPNQSDRESQAAEQQLAELEIEIL